ncbi:MAG TPA: hypothetical protein DD666_10170 [Advenella kashmirensis]|uniref:BrnT family toxin n=1 Tax=Advenella kashmirensis TaxID=310575 RepID=A0A356LFK4_9BURK|nr:hypothetical protein [Advenella kashmirensis]
MGKRLSVTGFDWDAGNWPKCAKHGLSRIEVEEIFDGLPMVMADPHPGEPRMRAIGKTRSGRYVFLVFMIRVVNGRHLIRPISARYMHQKEITFYEQQHRKT